MEGDKINKDYKSPMSYTEVGKRGRSQAALAYNSMSKNFKIASVPLSILVFIELAYYTGNNMPIATAISGSLGIIPQIIGIVSVLSFITYVIVILYYVINSNKLRYDA